MHGRAASTDDHSAGQGLRAPDSRAAAGPGRGPGRLSPCLLGRSELSERTARRPVARTQWGVEYDAVAEFHLENCRGSRDGRVRRTDGFLRRGGKWAAVHGFLGPDDQPLWW